jgi:hypothetical protein
LYRGINDCGKGYQPRTYIIKNEKGGLAADIRSLLVRWRNNFCQVLNLLGVMMIGRLKYSRDSLVPETRVFDVEMFTEKLKRHKSPGIDEIPAQFNKANNIKIRSESHKLINSIWNKEEFPEE